MALRRSVAMIRVGRMIAVLILANIGVTEAQADRLPSAEERTSIEAALKQIGFKSWKEIELDDGLWEVEDAVHADGRKYELKLDPKTLTVVKQELDD
jgi:uncharacterized membrane protein YkoI